jgi:hypothetical protein
MGVGSGVGARAPRILLADQRPAAEGGSALWVYPNRFSSRKCNPLRMVPTRKLARQAEVLDLLNVLIGVSIAVDGGYSVDA